MSTHLHNSYPKSTYPHSAYPHSADLVLAVKHHLEQQVLSQLKGNDAFQLRVALHTLAIIERELRQTLEEQSEHANSLENHLEELTSQKDIFLAEKTLIENIKSGKWDEHNTELMQYLKEITLQQLALNNPLYQHELLPHEA